MSQTIYVHGTILTMEDPLFAESVLTEDGTILAVGSQAEIETIASPDAVSFDLKGRTMLPAFLDAHSHFSGYANSLLQVPLEECFTAEEIIARIRLFIESASLSEDDWILCKGYDHNQLPGQSHIDRFVLDRASHSHPIAVQHKSGHLGVFNSAALTRLGVTEQTPVPAGGLIEKKNGLLTGYMEENAFLSFLQMIPMPSPEALIKAFTDVQERYASYGITTIQEGMMVDSLIPLYQSLLQHQLLRLDVVGYMDAQNSSNLSQAFASHLGKYQDHFKLGGYKVFLDGSPQGRTAWMRTPYLGTNDYYGYGTLSDEALLRAIEKASSDSLQILAHCNGDAACAQYLSCIAKAQRRGYHVQKIRPVMIHAQFLGRDQLDLVRDLEVIPSFFAAHVYHWGDTHIKNFGLPRASQISPAASAQKKGIRFTFHQDAPVIEPDMMETVWCAVNRKTRSGLTLGEEERISVLDALRAITLHAAYQYFEEDKKGSIAPGKSADFVILSENPLEIPKENLHSVKICHTIKEDHVIYTREE